MLLEKIRRRTTCSAALRWARWNVERVGISALLADRPSDAIRPQPYDLWNLYRTVRWRTPRVTMEFGVGCSTIAIAAALHRNGSGRHIVVEANERWLEASRQELPSHLRNIVTYVHSRVQKIGHNDGTCHVFTDRLLNARGLHETLFLGSSTMRPAIAALVPEAQFMRRERFSTLSWAGSKKLSRMPARSARTAKPIFSIGCSASSAMKASMILARGVSAGGGVAGAERRAFERAALRAMTRLLMTTRVI